MRMTLCTLALLFCASSTSGAIQYPIAVSSDQRGLVDATGQMVSFNATTPWHVLARLTREDTLVFLDARAAQDINAMLMSLVVAEFYNTGSTVNAYGDPPFLVTGDFSTPNEVYFSHVDWVLERMHERGITSFLMPVYLGWGCGEEGWCDEAMTAGETTMRDFGRWVGSRYRDQPNIVWIHGGDVDASLFGATAVNDALIEGIREFDPDHLHTAHCSRFRSGAECYEQPWLDFNTTYSDCTRTPLDLREDYTRTPTRPFVYIEGIYEAEHAVTAECVRAQGYWSALGGAAGHFYGSGQVWDFPSTWLDGMQSEGAVSLLYLGRLLDSRGWPTLVPDYEHLTVVAGYGDIGGSGYVAAALTPSRNSMIAYLPAPSTITVDLTRFTGIEVDATWYEPSSGEAVFIGRIPTVGTRQFTSPAGTDWVLVIDDAAADLVDVWVQPTAAAPDPTTVRLVRLWSATPNPFNPRTRIEFSGPATSVIRITVSDARGREVAHLFEGRATGALQSVHWDADGVASGTYFVRARGEGREDVLKVLLLK